MVSDILWGVLFVGVAVAILFFFVRMVKKSMTGDCGCGCSGGQCAGCRERLKKK